MNFIQSSGEYSLDKVQKKFKQWRNSPDRSKAIPDALWEAAASLYPDYSLHRISKALSLNHTKLKHYVHKKSPNPSLPTASFIELGFAEPTLPFRGIIEMQHQNGARMTMRITDSQDLIKITQLFWSQP